MRPSYNPAVPLIAVGLALLAAGIRFDSTAGTAGAVVLGAAIGAAGVLVAADVAQDRRLYRHGTRPDHAARARDRSREVPRAVRPTDPKDMR